MDSCGAQCRCGADIPANIAFCPACGRPAQSSSSAQCVHCGEDIAIGHAFCRLCGRSCSEPEQQPSPRGRVAKWPLGAIILAGMGAGWFAFHLGSPGAVAEQKTIHSLDEVQNEGPPKTSLDRGVPDSGPILRDISRPPTDHPDNLSNPSKGLPAGPEPVAPPAVPVTEQPVARLEPPPAVQPTITPSEVRSPPSETFRDPVPTPVVLPPPVPRREPSKREGDVIWSGVLEKGQVITIDSSITNSGELRGALPGAPVLISVVPQDIGVVEMPGPSNGWRRMSLRSKSRRNSVVTIHWSLLM